MGFAHSGSFSITLEEVEANFVFDVGRVVITEQREIIVPMINVGCLLVSL